MNTLIAKLRISAALDRDQQLPAAAPTRPVAPATLHQFEATLRDLDARLRAGRPSGQVPPGLHASVMRAVRAAAEKPQPRRAGPIWRLALASACVLVLAAVAWFAGRPAQSGPRPNTPLSLADATATLEHGSRWAILAPEAAMTPLTREWEQVQRDARGAVEFLLAAVP